MQKIFIALVALIASIFMGFSLVYAQTNNQATPEPTPSPRVSPSPTITPGGAPQTGGGGMSF